MSTIPFRFGRNRCVNELSNNNSNLSEAEERRSCWSVLSINRVVIKSKIIHKRGGKFKILDDNRVSFVYLSGSIFCNIVKSLLLTLELP